MTMTVEQVMTSFPKSLAPDASIRQASAIMRDNDIGVIPIVNEGGELLAMLTDRDIVIRAVAEGHGVDTPVRECMSGRPDTVAKDTTVEQAMLLMSQQQVRRLPVVEFGRLIGIISLGDLADSSAPQQEKAETLEQISASADSLRTAPPADLN